jgi:hypothetical protein
MSNCQVKEELVETRSLVMANRRDITNLITADPVANQVEIKNLVQTNCKLQDVVCTLQKDMFAYFKKRLLP